MKIVLASGNQGKIKEFNQLVEGLGITFVPQSDWGLEGAEETGLTFIENAILKARYASERTGLPAVSDDSGIAVDALSGAPGVASARYEKSDSARNQKLLNALVGVPFEKRTAAYYSVVVYLKYPKDPAPLCCFGKWEGVIASAPQGDGGFGYDPIFYIPSLECTAAEISSDQKNKRSHRAQAMRQLLGMGLSA